MSIVRIGIVGAGAVAHHHLKVLQALQDVEVVALANRGEEHRERVAKEFGIARTYPNHQEMLAEEDLDGIFVVTSVDTIYPITKELIHHKLPLLIEKPAGLNAAQTRELAKLAQEAGTRIMVGYNRRFYSVIGAADAAIKEHGSLLGLSIEAPERIETVRTLGKFSEQIIEEWLAANGTHGIDLLRFLGGDNTSVQAVHRAFKEKNGDNFGAVLSFANEAVGHYISHWNTPGRWQLTLYGEGVRARLEPIEQGALLIGEQVSELPVDQVDVDFKPGFYKQAEYFVERIRDGMAIERPACSIQDAVGTMELAELISGRSST